MKLVLIFVMLMGVMAFAEEQALQEAFQETLQKPTQEPPSKMASSSESESFPWQLGFEWGGGLALSKIDYDTGASFGLGWSLGVQIEKKLSSHLRILLSGGYQSLTLGRVVSSLGATIQGSLLVYSQTQEGPFGQGLLGFPIWKSGKGTAEQLMAIMDVGAEYFHPVKALQSSSYNTEYEFNPSRFMFLVAGPTLVWKVRKDWELWGSARYYINTVGDSQFKLMGIRLGLALSKAL